MKTETKIILLAFVLVVTIFLFSLGVMVRNMEDSNSWTDALCNDQEGELEQNMFYDSCWIEGKESRAKFVRTGEYYSNLTNSDEIERWRLIEK